jgi:hypothetical protein
MSRNRPAARSFRPQLEGLEQRDMPAPLAPYPGLGGAAGRALNPAAISVASARLEALVSNPTTNQQRLGLAVLGIYPFQPGTPVGQAFAALAAKSGQSLGQLNGQVSTLQSQPSLGTFGTIQSLGSGIQTQASLEARYILRVAVTGHPNSTDLLQMVYALNGLQHTTQVTTNDVNTASAIVNGSGPSTSGGM